LHQTLIGYARTSTLDQVDGFEAQLTQLKAAGCKKIFKEQVSSVDIVAREQLAAALDYVREGDVFVVTKLDRLARSVAHLLQISEELSRKDVALRILDLNIDTSAPTGKLMLTMLGGIAEFERAIMLERQREGIARAKRQGKFKGRKPTARAKADEAKALLASGRGPTAVAKELGISRASLWRIVKSGEVGM
jgi:DNA invertase Pin-like site-specific DNA recombinase